ncbi:MAG: hypothetical protein ABI811_15775 [Acidobacteriota bacterium]
MLLQLTAAFGMAVVAFQAQPQVPVVRTPALTPEQTRERAIESHVDLPKPAPAIPSPLATACKSAWASGFVPERSPLCLASFRVLLNSQSAGTTTADPQQFAAALKQRPLGSPAWIYIPGRGRYWISLTPVPGLTQAGEVHGDTITFTLFAERVTLNSTVPLIPNEQTYPVYLKRDAAWTPESAADAIQSGTCASRDCNP